MGSCFRSMGFRLERISSSSSWKGEILYVEDVLPSSTLRYVMHSAIALVNHAVHTISVCITILLLLCHFHCCVEYCVILCISVAIVM